MIALAGLAVVNIPFLTQMGLAAAGTVVVSVVIALTLLPALLGFIGPRVLGGRIPGLRSHDPEQDEGHTLGSRWGVFVAGHPVPVLLVGVLALLTIAVPALDIRLGLPDDGMAAADTTQRKAYDLLSAGFGPGFNGPLTVVVDTTGAKVLDPATKVASAVAALPDVVAVTPPIVNPAGNTAILSVIPKSGPNDPATGDLVSGIRDSAAVRQAQAGAAVAVTGPTAINIDISGRIAQSLLPYLALVVGLAILLLMLVFRSILVPVKAALGFLLSVAAAFGAVVAVFQWGWLSGLLGVAATGPIVSLMPIFLIGVVFGLAMDYEVFLVTRMREEFVHGTEPTQAVITGFRHGVRVVTAAAIIMISVFAGFLSSHETLIKAMGFALAAAVALDAFVVRMTIVPAVMTLLGRSAWWLPGWLDRLLPSVDVESESLRRELDSPEPEPDTTPQSDLTGSRS